MPIDMSVELADFDFTEAFAADDALLDSEPTIVEPAEAAEPEIDTSSAVADPVTAPPETTPPYDARTEFYSSLSVTDAEKLRAAAGRLTASTSLAARTLLDIGRELITISDELPGYFEVWLRLEFEMSRATAYNYMNAARHFASEPDVVSALPATTVYKLASKTTPDEVRDSVVRQITAGNPVSAEEVEERISKAKAKVAEEKRGKVGNRKRKHPPAANDDVKTAALELAAGTGGYVAVGRPANEEADPRVEVVAVSGATGKRLERGSGSKQDLAEQAAREALASLRIHLTANTLEQLVTCARSEAAWNALRKMLATQPATNVAA